MSARSVIQREIDALIQGIRNVEIDRDHFDAEATRLEAELRGILEEIRRWLSSGAVRSSPEKQRADAAARQRKLRAKRRG